MGYQIYIGDANSDTAHELTDLLTKSGSRIRHFNHPEELTKTLRESTPDLLLLHNDFVKSEDEAFPSFFSQIPTITYANRLELETQTALYEQGVKKVIVGEENLPLQVAIAGKMVMYRLRQLQELRQKALTQGSIQAFSVFDVIRNAFVEKKNLILKVTYKDWNARVRIFQGQAVNAITPHLNGVDALLKILQVHNGNYLIRSYRKMEETSSIPNSTPALLLESRYQEQVIRRFLRRCGIEAGNPTFRIQPFPEGTIFRSDVELKILSLIEKNYNFREILLYNPYPVIKTVHHLSQLLERGIVIAEESGAGLESFLPKDIEFLKSHVLQPDAVQGNVVILGLPSSGRSELIRTFSGTRAPIKSLQSVDFTRIRLQPDLTLTIFGITIDQTLMPILEKISQDMVACIFLVDLSQPQQFEYSSYLLKQLVQLYPVPFVVGLTNYPAENDRVADDFKKKFPVPLGLKVLTVRPDSFPDLRNLLHNLRHVITEEDEAMDYA